MQQIRKQPDLRDILNVGIARPSKLLRIILTGELHLQCVSDVRRRRRQPGLLQNYRISMIVVGRNKTVSYLILHYRSGLLARVQFYHQINFGLLRTYFYLCDSLGYCYEHKTVTELSQKPQNAKSHRRGNQWIKPMSSDATAVKTGGSRGNTATHTSGRYGPSMERDLRLASVLNANLLMFCIIWTISP
jgi:hypothetical protein